MNKAAMAPTGCQRESHLVARYGELLSLQELADLLKYPSKQALRQAHRRGALPVQLIRMPNRRGWFAATRRIAAFLDELDATSSGSVNAIRKEPAVT